MASMVFDSDRDCTREDVYQDVRMTRLANGGIGIEQWDGAGEDYHHVVIPAHMVVQFAVAIACLSEPGALVEGVLDGRPFGERG